MNAAKLRVAARFFCAFLLLICALCAHGEALPPPDGGARVEFAQMPPCNLPEKVATGFSEAMLRLVGARYTPVLYVGRQALEDAELHLIICRQVISALGAPEHLVLLTLERKEDGTFAGAWAVAGIERIV